MKALISPNEVIAAGYRVAEVCENEFEVAAPLFWVNCPDNVNANEYLFNPATEGFESIPQPAVPDLIEMQGQHSQEQPISQGAQTL